MISTEQYLHEQIKKAPGHLEDVFMQAVPVEQIRIMPCAASTRTEATHCKEPTNREWEERHSTPPIMQNGQVSSRHNISDNQPHYTAVGDEQRATMRNS